MSSGPKAASADAVPFILPGPIADRETVAGWRQWRLTRHNFVPATRLSLADYRRLSPASGSCTTCTARPPTRTCRCRTPR